METKASLKAQRDSLLKQMSPSPRTARHMRVSERTAIEHQLWAVHRAVEHLGASPLLTEAATHLQLAADRLVDWYVANPSDLRPPPPEDVWHTYTGRLDGVYDEVRGPDGMPVAQIYGRTTDQVIGRAQQVALVPEFISLAQEIVALGHRGDCRSHRGYTGAACDCGVADAQDLLSRAGVTPRGP